MCAVQFGFYNFWVEYDSQVLVKAINSGGFDLSPQSALLTEIRALIVSLSVRGVIIFLVLLIRLFIILRVMPFLKLSCV